MAYIGREPQIGNFQVCDAISVVNGQAAYTMQVSSVNVSPETANHMIVSLNGIIQAPGSSYTVSGSTITFASNLVTGDVIDFIHILGSVLDLGVPSDNTVSLAKLTASGTKDATTFLRGDNTFAEAGGGQWEYISSSTISAGTSAVDFTTLSTDYEDFLFTLQNVHQATDGQRLYGRVFTGTGGSQAVDTGSNYGYSVTSMTTGHSTEGNNATDHMRFSYINGADTTESFNAEIILYNPHGTTYQKFFRSIGMGVSSANASHSHDVGAKYGQTTAVTGVRFYSQSGNLDDGKISLYGRKNN